MRILLVVHGFPPAARGGTEIYAGAHARTLHDRFGDEVFVLAREQDPSRPDYAARCERRRGVEVTWINNTFRKTTTFAGTYLNPSIDAVASRLIDAIAPDVAHVHHLTCLSTGIVRTLADRRIPVFMTVHDYWLLCHRGQLLDVTGRVCRGPEPSGCANCLGSAAGIGRAGYAVAAGLRGTAAGVPPALARRLLNGARRAADRLASPRRAAGEAGRRLAHMREVSGRITTFFAPSDAIRRRFVDFGVAPERIQLAPYGIERRPDAIQHPESGPLRIGYAGSLMISKAPHLAIEVFDRLPPESATLDVFGAYAAYHGDDGYWPTLATWAGRGRVRFHGGVPHDRVADIFSAIDVLVVPSIWPETSPIVIREALDAGIPVVASRIGGIPETVTDGVNGLLFTPGDKDDLHRALSRLVAEPGLVASLRRGTGRARPIEEDVAFTRGFYPDRAGAARATAAATPRSVNSAATRTAAIVLSHGSPDEAILAVRSLQGSRHPARIIVVENGARSDTREALAALGADVTVIQTGRNLGFPAGMNVGIRAAIADGATHAFLVNSDMIVPPDCLGLLHAALLSTGAGIAGPVVLSRSTPDRIGTLGISYQSATGRMKHESFGAHVPSMEVLETGQVDAICGCALLVSREVIDAIGPLDEEYFFSFEDLDWCFRARRAGFASVLAADATAYHQGSATMGEASPLRLYYAARNHLRFARREARGQASGSLASVWRGTAIVALNVAHAVRARGGSMPARLAAVARGTRDHFAGRYGEG
jgi:GT2 family glycosyltransferase/glycosyltransferase involved in cell wall biosynthesis